MLLLECKEEWERHRNHFKYYHFDRKNEPNYYPCIVVDKTYIDKQHYEAVEFEFIYKEDFDV